MYKEADLSGSVPFNPCAGRNGAVASQNFPERAPRERGARRVLPKTQYPSLSLAVSTKLQGPHLP